MEIICDTREDKLCVALQQNLQHIPATAKWRPSLKVMPMTIGDVAIRCGDDEKPWILIERKSWADMTASIRDGRYEEQSIRLQSGVSNAETRFVYYWIEGAPVSTEEQRKFLTRLMTSLTAIKGFMVWHASNVADTAKKLLWIVEKMWEKQKERIQRNTTASVYSQHIHVERKENVVPANIGEIWLRQIPSLGAVASNEIMRLYGGNFGMLLDDMRAGNFTVLQSGMLSGGKKRKFASSQLTQLREFLTFQPNKENISSESDIITCDGGVVVEENAGAATVVGIKTSGGEDEIICWL